MTFYQVFFVSLKGLNPSLPILYALCSQVPHTVRDRDVKSELVKFVSFYGTLWKNWPFKINVTGKSNTNLHLFIHPK